MRKVIGWDTETHLITPGNKTPRMVCLSLAGGPDTLEAARDLWSGLHGGPLADLRILSGGGWELVVTRELAFDAFCWAAQLADVLVAHNAPYDWAVMANEFPALVPAMFAAFESGLARDTQIREMLIAIATGNFKMDHRCRKNPGNWPLSHLVYLYFKQDISATKVSMDRNGNVVGGNINDSWRLRYSELDGVPMSEWPRAAISYAAEDSTWARKCFIAQSEPFNLPEGVVVRDDGDVVNELEQNRAALSLHLMACHGVRTDLHAVLEFERVVRIEAEQAMSIAAGLGFVRVNRCKVCEGTGWVGSVPNLRPCMTCEGREDMDCRARGIYASGATKPFEPAKHLKRLRALVFHAYGGDPPMSDPSSEHPRGQVKTDADTLAGARHEGLVAYSEALGAEKLLNQYVPILHQGINAALTSDPNPLVRSGRTSWRNPNMQNPPRKGGFRDCFIPRPGKVFASVDYTGQEMVCLAQVLLNFFGHSVMADVLNQGKDLHIWFAGLMLGLDYEEALLRYKAGDKEVKAKRQNAKIGNFGLPGGLGVATFVEYAAGFGVTLTFNEAGDIIEAWREAFPEMVLYFEMIGAAAGGRGSGGFTVRQHVSGRLRGDCTYTSACNTYFQGLGADATKAAMWAVTKACYTEPDSPLYGVRLWAMIHDELLAEGPEGTAHLWAPEISRLMVEAMIPFTPDLAAAVKAPPALMRRWLKDAEPTYDAAGKLIPWEPS